jgi:hypothetical protein
MDAENKITAIEWGSFAVRQDGMTVASGSGPYTDIQREAAHYAMVYRQDGPVRVSVRKLKPRIVSQDVR